MPKINLPPLKIPKKILADKELRDYFYQLQNTVYGLFLAIVDGDSTVIDDLQQSDIYDTQGPSQSDIEDEYLTIDSLIPDSGPLFVQFNPVSKNTNYTALDFGFIEAEQGITVSLPEYPDDASEVIVANGDGSRITIDGNGKQIKRKSLTKTLTSFNEGTTLHFQYFVERGYWRTR